ncbi:trypsin-like peptidase domain-containing protein [Streptomyces cinereoruber]|uniref:trypsin-like peptidase domain-containing protein n=1 Tax=Streptomyces cinereoruber TaxID=67260 RepID=UPI003C2CFDAC
MGRGDLATLVRICDPAGRTRGTGFLADHHGTVVTSHEAVDGLSRVLLRAPDDRSWLAEAGAVTPLPESGLALVRSEGLGIRPLPLATRPEIEPGTYVRIEAHGWREARVLGPAAVTYTAADRFHDLDQALELAIGTEGAEALRRGGRAAGSPVLDTATGTVLAVLGTALHGGRRAAGYAVPLRPDGPLTDLLRRNAATVPAYGPDLNLAGILELTATSTGPVGDPGPWPEPVERAACARELDRFTTGDAPVLALVGTPGTGRTTALAALCARRARGEAPAPTIRLRGADLRAEDHSLADAVGRALERAGRIVAASGALGDTTTATPERAAALAREAGRPLLVVLDGPEEMPPLLAHRLPAWTGATERWLRTHGVRLATACRPEHWERAGALYGPEALHRPAPGDNEDGLPPAVVLGPYTEAEARAVREGYGLRETDLAEADARHPLALRLLAEVRAALPGEVPGRPCREEVFTAHLDLMCLRTAVRIAAGTRPLVRGTAVRRLAARVTGRVHEAARRCLGPGHGVLDRASFEELFPWREGWAPAVLTEGLLVPAGSGYRFAHEELADWLQAAHLDLDTALHALVHTHHENRTPDAAGSTGPQDPGGTAAADPGAVCAQSPGSTAAAGPFAPSGAPGPVPGSPSESTGPGAVCSVGPGSTAAAGPFASPGVSGPRAVHAQSSGSTAAVGPFAPPDGPGPVPGSPTGSAGPEAVCSEGQGGTAAAGPFVPPDAPGGTEAGPRLLAGVGASGFPASPGAPGSPDFPADPGAVTGPEAPGSPAGPGVPGPRTAPDAPGSGVPGAAAGPAPLPGAGAARPQAPPVPRHRIGPVLQALLLEHRERGAGGSVPRLAGLVEALARFADAGEDGGGDGAWWAARLLGESLRRVPDPRPCLPVLRLLADRIGARPGRRPAFAAFGPEFWRGLAVGEDERIDLLRRLVTADPPGEDRWFAAVAGLLAADPRGVQPLLCRWFGDARPLPAAPHATVATGAQALLHAHRHLAVDDLCEALVATAHPLAEGLLTALARDETSALCRAVDRWAHDDGRPERRAAAAAYGHLAAGRATAPADRELLRYAALALLARPADRDLHGAALGLLIRDPESRDRHLPRAAIDPGVPVDALVEALATHPDEVLDALWSRLDAPGGDPAAVLGALAGIDAPAPARRVAALVRDHALLRPGDAPHVAAFVDRRLEAGPEAGTVLLPLVGDLIRSRSVPLRRALAPVLAAPGTGASRHLRAELLDVLLEHERYEAEAGAGETSVLEALLTAAAEDAERRSEPRTRRLTHRAGLLCVRTAEGAARLDRLLAALVREWPVFTELLGGWIVAAPGDWAPLLGIETLDGLRFPGTPMPMRADGRGHGSLRPA